MGNFLKKIVIAVDSFKGSMSSMEAGKAVQAGFSRIFPECSMTVLPVADGGEGTVDAVTEGLGGEKVTVTVTGPLGSPVQASYGIIPEKQMAVMEMAEASGITLVKREELDPARATTYGTGEMILDAARQGCREFLMGIGGSATTDGGAGMLSALGYEFLDETGAAIQPGAGSLGDIAQIRDEKVPQCIKESRFRIACDVQNPLLGEAGAVFVYGPQKGVKLEERTLFDQKMAHYAKKSAEFSGKDCKDIPGAGAAGGMGFAFLNYLNSSLEPGISLVLGILGFQEKLEGADLVITGEGRMDAQTAMGKVPVGIAKMAKEKGRMVIAFAGGVTEDAEKCNEAGIDAFFPIVRGVTDLDTAMEKGHALHNMEAAAVQAARLIRTVKDYSD